MQESPTQLNAAAGPVVPYPALRRCLSFDLEIWPEDGSLLAAAAYRPDTEDSLSMSGRPSSGNLHRLDRAAEGAQFRLGP